MPACILVCRRIGVLRRKSVTDSQRAHARCALRFLHHSAVIQDRTGAVATAMVGAPNGGTVAERLRACRTPEAGLCVAGTTPKTSAWFAGLPAVQRRGASLISSPCSSRGGA